MYIDAQSLRSIFGTSLLLLNSTLVIFLINHAKAKVKLTKYLMKINLIKMANHSKSNANPNGSCNSKTKITLRVKGSNHMNMD